MLGDPKNSYDLAIIGSGFAGLAAAQRAHEQGLEFCLIGQNFGGTQHFSGAFDVLDFDWASPQKLPPFSSSLVAALGDYVAAHPQHLYARLCPDAVSAAGLISGLRDFLNFFDLPYRGDGERSVAVLTPRGHCRQTAFALRTQVLAESLLQKGGEAVLVTVKGVPDYPAGLISKNLSRYFGKLRVLEYAGFSPNFSAPLSSVISCLDEGQAMEDFTQFLCAHIKSQALIILPPILGLKKFLTNHEVLQGRTACSIVEMLSLFPSVSGLRLTAMLEKTIAEKKWPRFLGRVVTHDIQDRQIISVTVRSQEREEKIQARDFVLASGKYVGGGIGHEGHFAENLFDLPLALGGEPLSSHTHITQLLARRATDPQAFMRVGVDWKNASFSNLKICGHVLADFDFTRDLCGFAVSVASAQRCLAR